MNEMSIADALTELKRIKKLLVTRNNDIERYSSKRKGSKDEIENQKAWVDSQFDSAKDLIQRYVDIKLAINKSNLETPITHKGKTYSVAEGILFKQHTHDMLEELYESFTPDRGDMQVAQHARLLGVNIAGALGEEELARIELVPELMYDDKQIRLLKEELLDLYSYMDALIEKSNHHTFITL